MAQAAADAQLRFGSQGYRRMVLMEVKIVAIVHIDRRPADRITDAQAITIDHSEVELIGHG